MKHPLFKIISVCCMLAGHSLANDDFNVGITAVGGMFDLVGLSDAGGPRLFPGDGGMGGALSVDVMLPFFADMNLRTGLAIEYRDFRGGQKSSYEECPFGEACKEYVYNNDVIVSLLYLELPAWIRVHASPTVVAEGGPVLGLNVLSKYYGPYASVKSEWKDLEETSLFEIGFAVNLALQMTENLEMSFRLAYMITDVMDEEELGYELPSQTFKFHGGFTYWFGGGLAPRNVNEKKTSP